MDAYLQSRKANHGFAFSTSIATGGTTSTLLTVSTEQSLVHKIHVQRIRVVVITASAGKTWTIQDNNASPVIATPALDMGTAGVEFVYDFGPTGFSFTAGKNMTLTISAAGAAGVVIVEGYQEQTHTAV